ncbi:hypothetical protein M2266_000749 [Streptomyces sp. SPB162]|nr:hypothetical protein [Streptomyces sp. SPB162]
MVQLPVPVSETWIWKPRAYAASQVNPIWLTEAVAPRSTWIHCGSLNALDQRVPVLPSTAAPAAVPAFSADDAVAGFPCESSAPAAPAGGWVMTKTRPASNAISRVMRR